MFMTDRELKKLTRVELLEMLIEQSKKVRQLQAELDAANARLESRDLAISKAGSIAEASLQLSGIFDAAQQAANQYLMNVQQMQSRCDHIEADAIRRSEQMLSETQAKCDMMITRAEAESKRWWEEATQRINALYTAQAGLREFLNSNPQAISR